MSNVTYIFISLNCDFWDFGGWQRGGTFCLWVRSSTRGSVHGRDGSIPSEMSVCGNFTFASPPWCVAIEIAFSQAAGPCTCGVLRNRVLTVSCLFQRPYNSISCLFSMQLSNPTPAASTKSFIINSLCDLLH